LDARRREGEWDQVGRLPETKGCSAEVNPMGERLISLPTIKGKVGKTKGPPREKSKVQRKRGAREFLEKTEGIDGKAQRRIEIRQRGGNQGKEGR